MRSMRACVFCVQQPVIICLVTLWGRVSHFTALGAPPKLFSAQNAHMRTAAVVCDEQRNVLTRAERSRSCATRTFSRGLRGQGKEVEQQQQQQQHKVSQPGDVRALAQC